MSLHAVPAIRIASNSSNRRTKALATATPIDVFPAWLRNRFI